MTNILHYIQSNAFPLPQILKIFCSLPAVSEGDVARTIYTFPHASAGDPDGIRPQHMIDITNSPAERGKKELFQALTSFTNNTLMRNVPPSVRPVFFGASLIPLQKEGGGGSADCYWADSSPSGGKVCGSPYDELSRCQPCSFAAWMWSFSWL